MNNLKTRIRKARIFLLCFGLITVISQITFGQSLEWAQKLGGEGEDRGNSIVMDSDENVYVTGFLASEKTAFVSKIDASGNFLWTKQFNGIGGLSMIRGHFVAVDNSGNVYTAGAFKGSVDFDPGSGSFNQTSTGGNFDIYVSKLDASGNFVWAKKMGGGGDDRGYGIAVDNNGNVYTTGSFMSTADFDPGSDVFNLTSAGSRDIFVSKLDTDGNFMWAKQLGGSNDNQGYSIAVDDLGNVYTTGYFSGTVDFDPGGGWAPRTSAGNRDVFVSKLDTHGDFIWAKQMGGTNEDTALSITVDSSGNVYTTGVFKGTADFDPGAGNVSLTSNGHFDAFISKLNSSGDYQWVKHISSIGYDEGHSVVTDVYGNVYVTGWFSNVVSFNLGPDGSII